MGYEELSALLAPFEDAARVWCKDKGRDPDTMIKRPHPRIAGAEIAFPYWISVATQLEELNGLLSALQRANRARAKKEPVGGHA